MQNRTFVFGAYAKQYSGFQGYKKYTYGSVIFGKYIRKSSFSFKSLQYSYN